MNFDPVTSQSGVVGGMAAEVLECRQTETPLLGSGYACRVCSGLVVGGLRRDETQFGLAILLTVK